MNNPYFAFFLSPGNGVINIWALIWICSSFCRRNFIFLCFLGQHPLPIFAPPNKSNPISHNLSPDASHKQPGKKWNLPANVIICIAISIPGALLHQRMRKSDIAFYSIKKQSVPKAWCPHLTSRWQLSSMWDRTWRYQGSSSNKNKERSHCPGESTHGDHRGRGWKFGVFRLGSFVPAHPDIK